MSARLGMNEPAYVSWKKQSFTQITSKIQKNKIQFSNGSTNIFRANPCAIYRREISDISNIPCRGNARTSIRVNQFEQPGGSYIATKSYQNYTGVESILDKKTVKTVNQYNEYACNQGPSPSQCLSTQNNALKRVRGSSGVSNKRIQTANGIVKQKYCTRHEELLYANNDTFDQNQFNYFIGGNANVEAGTPAASNNQYVSAGPNHCPVYYKPTNYKYSQNGGVDSSTRMDRLKYDTLNTIGASYKGAFGAAMSNALAYGVTTIGHTGYTAKDKLGFPPTLIPVISQNGTLQKCFYRRARV